MVQIQHKRASQGVHAYAKTDLVWNTTEKKGMSLAAVRASREDGQFLGYLNFERFAETGVHQHLGPAFSYFLEGGLSDFQGSAVAGEMGINLEGATHSAIAYASTLMASRLEAPVIYPSEESVRGEVLHTGAKPGEIVNHAPEMMPDINIPLESLKWQGTVHGGLQRRLIFDYKETEFDRRSSQIRLLPYTKLPTFFTNAPMDIFVIGGDLTVSGESAIGGDFMVLDEGARADFSTEFGCLALIWSEAPVRWHDADFPDPFGF
ncbi:cupin domain-containing protein [Pseudahrensia aquimaris]|uniref:Cupin domain-containing protein n=1 Tax=Pseudahrensia aquimaris TaxID=744461 RepID=A0ABW3FA92_9HYPH